MSWARAIVCFLLPPLAVIDKGPKTVAFTLIMTLLGWIPGVIVALIHSSRPRPAAFA